MSGVTEDEVRRSHLAACRSCRALFDYADDKADTALLEAARRQLSEHVRYEGTRRVGRSSRAS